MNATIQHYIASSLVTFAATFFSVIGAQLLSNASLVTSSATWHVAIASIVIAAVRAGIKAVVPDYSVSAITAGKVK